MALSKDVVEDRLPPVPFCVYHEHLVSCLRGWLGISKDYKRKKMKRKEDGMYGVCWSLVAPLLLGTFATSRSLVDVVARRLAASV